MKFKQSYIVVEGPVGVGKTTLAKNLADSFGADLILESAVSNPFLEKFYRQPEQTALSTQLHFLLQRAEQLRSLYQADLFRKLVVADYLMEKDRIFAEVTLSHDELALYEQVYAQLTINVPQPDLVVYLQAPVSVLYERIHKRGIGMEQGISRDYLQRLADAYTTFFHKYHASALLIVNAEDIDFANNPNDYKQLLDRIMAVNGGRHYFNPLSIPA